MNDKDLEANIQKLWQTLTSVETKLEFLIKLLEEKKTNYNPYLGPR